MQISAASFLIDNIQPLQRVAQHFEDQAAQRQIKQKEDVRTEAPVVPNDNLEKLKQTLAENNITMKFSRDEVTQALVVELVNTTTGEAIRQMPSEVSLKLAADFIKLQGQFVDEK